MDVNEVNENCPKASIFKHCCCVFGRPRNPRRRREHNLNSHLTLLVLGAGEAGKSTFIKQIRIIHGTSYSTQERREFTKIVYQNIFMAMDSLVRAMDLLGITYENPRNVENACLVKEVNYMTVTTFEEPFVGAIRDLWNDSGVQDCYQRRREYQITDSAQYYLSDLERFAEKNYLPTLQDILRIKVPTTGINSYLFEVDRMNFWLIDVGGQRGERRKWIHMFEHVNTYIIFLVAGSEYDQVLFEDANVNRLKESLELFKLIISYPCFSQTKTILFINKIDILEEKIKTSNLADYFPEFQGPEKDFNAAQKFIKELFLNCVPGKKDNIYPHLTCATDTNNIKVVFSVVKDKILQQHLEQVGLL